MKPASVVPRAETTTFLGSGAVVPGMLRFACAAKSRRPCMALVRVEVAHRPVEHFTRPIHRAA